MGVAIRDGLNDLANSLLSTSAMAGSNKAGCRCASYYAVTAGAVVGAVNSLVKECGAKADVFNTAGVKYFNAEQASKYSSFRTDGV